VLRELAYCLAERHPGLDRDAVARVLAERERVASTAIGEGIAIPHGKLETANGLIACFARSRRGIDYDSVDGQPTHFFIVLVAPLNSAGEHLKALARISRLFKNRDFRTRMLKARTSAEMYEIIASEDAAGPP
jgi:nitrogen PTS system EIIA component